MQYIIDGVIEAFKLIINFDPEIYEIILLSLFVSITSTIIAAVISVPIGLFVSVNEFRGKRLFSKILYSLMGTPPVVIGLFVLLMISRKGPLGSFGVIYSPTAMIIAQVILVTPIIMSLIINNTSGVAKSVKEVCKTLGGNNFDTFKLLLNEVKVFIYVALITGFSRAVSEVGAVMIVGGNIKGHTRVMTTYIALNNSMGEYEKSIAMGIVLLLIAFTVNSISYKYVFGDKNGNKN